MKRYTIVPFVNSSDRNAKNHTGIKTFATDVAKEDTTPG
jgi:hypothetical protein